MTNLELKSLKTAPNLDGIIRQSGEAIFALNDTQRLALYFLGKHGPLTEYHLADESKINKDTVRRILRGRETSSNSLVNQGYVIQSLSSLFGNVKGKKEYEHLLTMKGLLASLYKPKNESWEELRFENNHLVCKIRNSLLKLCKNNTLVDVAILFMKYNMALFMAWHKINKVDLSIIDDLYLYFDNWNSTNPLVNPNSFYPTVNNTKKHQALVNLRDDFFAVSSVLNALLKEEKNGKKILQYIRKWVRLAETIRDSTYDSSLPNSSSLYPSPIEGEFVKQEKITETAKKILGDYGINSKLAKTIPNILQ